MLARRTIPFLVRRKSEPKWRVPKRHADAPESSHIWMASVAFYENAMHAKIITNGNLKKILEALKNTRERAMVLLSLKAGLRAVEIAHLKWGAIREDDTVIELVSTKGGKPRTVPVNKELQDALQAYRLDCKRTGATTSSSRRVTPSPGSR